MPIWDKSTFDALYRAKCWPYGIRGWDWSNGPIPAFNYHEFTRRSATLHMRDTILRLMQEPGFAQVSHVAMIGDGYGWVAQALLDAGASVVQSVSVDTSPHIIATADTSEEQELRDALAAQGWDWDNLPNVFVGPNGDLVDPRPFWTPRATRRGPNVPVMNEDLANNGSRNRVRSALSNQMDGILTMMVLDSQDSDADAATFAQRVDDLRPNPAVVPVHVVNGPYPTPLLPATRTPAEWRTWLDGQGFNDHAVATPAGQVFL